MNRKFGSPEELARLAAYNKKYNRNVSVEDIQDIYDWMPEYTEEQIKEIFPDWSGENND